MKNLFSMLFSAMKSKIIGIWRKLRLWCSPAFLKTKVLARIRDFFVRLLNIKPRHKRDYYPVFKWLVSKRLAFAIVFVIGLLAAMFIYSSLPEKNGDGEVAIDTYEYRSIPLKFHSGKVRILARDGYVAYEGNVSDGAANGKGKLFDSKGSLVYDGDFANNMYNGKGTFYYPNGNPKYIGGFNDNVFNGEGTFYRENGTMEYNGTVDKGEKSGKGTLYNSVGSPVYQGNFVSGGIAYSDFLEKTTSKVAELYSGETEIYEKDEEYCVVMSEINAIYSTNDGRNALENEWTVKTVYIPRNFIIMNGKSYNNIGDICEFFGTPMYMGTTVIELPEAVGWNRIASKTPEKVIPVEMETTEGFENVYRVSEYNSDYEIYIYSFEREGLIYTFYFNNAGESEFLMYSIEKA